MSANVLLLISNVRAESEIPQLLDKSACSPRPAASKPAGFRPPHIPSHLEPRQEVTVACGSVTVVQGSDPNGGIPVKSENTVKDQSPWFDLLGKALWPAVLIYFFWLFREQIRNVIASGELDLELAGNKLRLKSMHQEQQTLKEKAEFEEAVDTAEHNTVGDKKTLEASDVSDNALDKRATITNLPQESMESSKERPDRTGPPQPPTVPPKPRFSEFLNKYLKAEDLALRALQSEYGVPVQRQVTGGSDSGFDGVFSLGKRVYVVEVKYFNNSFMPDRLRSAVVKLESAIARYKWKDAQIIVVAVFQQLDDRAKKLERLRKATIGGSVPVVVRIFTMEELEAQFGVSG